MIFGSTNETYGQCAYYLKPNTLLVLDDIKLDIGHELELRFHPELLPKEKEGNVYSTTGRNAEMRLEVLTSENTKITVENLEAILRGDGSKKDSMPTIRLIKKAVSWRNAVAITWLDTGMAPDIVNLQEKGDTWVFSYSNNLLEFDWNSNTAKFVK